MSSDGGIPLDGRSPADLIRKFAEAYQFTDRQLRELMAVLRQNIRDVIRELFGFHLDREGCPQLTREDVLDQRLGLNTGCLTRLRRGGWASINMDYVVDYLVLMPSSWDDVLQPPREVLALAYARTLGCVIMRMADQVAVRKLPAELAPAKAQCLTQAQALRLFTTLFLLVRPEEGKEEVMAGVSTPRRLVEYVAGALRDPVAQAAIKPYLILMYAHLFARGGRP
jgi:hypothetical protein